LISLFQKKILYSSMFRYGRVMDQGTYCSPLKI
jgi:hypothetical protein